jgi:putative ABC transport system substrate-binding protein
MRRRAFLLVIGGAALGGTPLRSQQRTIVPTVGFISFATLNQQLRDAFLSGLREHGRIPGQSIQVEERYAENDLGRMRMQISDLLARATNVFVTFGNNATQMVEELSGTVSIVAAHMDTFILGPNSSIARPQGNITGFAVLSTDLVVKRLELMREVIPGVRRVVFLVNPQSVFLSQILLGLKEAAEKMRVDVRTLAVTPDLDLEGNLLSERSAGAQALLSPRDFLLETMRFKIVRAASAAGLLQYSRSARTSNRVG